MAELSPMMTQYMEVKKKHPDTVLFYRLGDFYEMFFDDALLASKELELTLTGRDCGLPERAPMCGVPFHSCENYIARLVEKGHKVAICEQMEDPALCKGLVKREVIRIVTPGTLIENTLLEEGRNNFIASFYLSGNTVGLSFADCSTGEINVGEFTASDVSEAITAELSSLSPAEVLLTEEFKKMPEVISCLADKLNAACEFINGTPDKTLVLRHFKVENFEALSAENYPVGQNALANLLSYLYATQMSGLENLRELRLYNNAGFMRLDYSTRRNLELCETMRTRERRGSLLGVVDKTRTAMGKRLLRSWLEQPLIDAVAIGKRQNAVAELVNETALRTAVRTSLDGMLDIERLMTRVVYGSANARDMVALRDIIGRLPSIKETLSSCRTQMLCSLNESILPLNEIYDLLCASIADDPPVTVREGNLIRAGYNAELDELREIVTNGKGVITRMEEEEKERTGIKNLRIGYNRVFGYYLEISNSNLDKIPEGYIRKQTLTNGERFINDRLKEWESRILGAQERIAALEYELFNNTRQFVADRLASVQTTAGAVAAVDVLASLAEVAVKNRYCMPEIALDSVIDIRGGRHPVVEDLHREEPFVPNDTLLNGTDDRTMIITGPNMAGKSTYMRQVAVIVLMAQVGMFVPATSAHIGVVDSIFTRVGASDDLSAGDSTFMVEMKEVAHILKNATGKSLVIFDEIGRGTSTFDGMSIARAAMEYMNDKICGKALFATHYHELTELENQLSGIRNYNISVRKKGDEVIFLRKLLCGSADQSLGIEIAKLAGCPPKMVSRAKEILAALEESEIASVQVSSRFAKAVEPEEEPDLMLVYDEEPVADAKAEIIEELKTLAAETLSPIEAMNILYRLSQKAKE